MYRRIVSAAIAGVVAVVFAAQPTFALGYGGDPFTGKVGRFGGPSGAEVTCRYNSAGRLRSMTMHPLKLWGNYDTETQVAQRYIVRQATEFQRGRLIYAGHFQRDLATSSTPADGFRDTRFYVREQLPGESAYYVSLAARWYDESSTIEGTANPLLYDRYLLKKGSQSRWSNACVFDYSVQYWDGG